MVLIVGFCCISSCICRSSGTDSDINIDSGGFVGGDGGGGGGGASGGW